MLCKEKNVTGHFLLVPLVKLSTELRLADFGLHMGALPISAQTTNYFASLSIGRH